MRLNHLFTMTSAAIFCLFATTSCSQREKDGKQPSTQEVGVKAILGTGDEQGVYYAVGKDLAALLDQYSENPKIQLEVEPSSGAVFNINALMIRAYDFGLAQMDRQWEAVVGESYWDEMPQQRLRFVASLYPEMITVIAAKDTQAETVQDLKGKTISIGSPGSGTQGNALEILADAGLRYGVDYEADHSRPTEAIDLLKRGQVDAVILTVGHPNPLVRKALEGENPAHFIAITDQKQLLRRYPYYEQAELPASLYEGGESGAPIPTVAMRTVLLTSADVDDAVVYETTKVLFENLAWLKEQNPVLSNLTPEEMVQGAIAPIHPGAMKFYVEQGLLQPTEPQDS